MGKVSGRDGHLNDKNKLILIHLSLANRIIHKNSQGWKFNRRTSDMSDVNSRISDDIYLPIVIISDEKRCIDRWR